MSVTVTCDVQGVEEFVSAVEHFSEAMQRQVRQQLSDWAEAVRAEAASNAPVRTGYLRSTIYARVKDWVAEVGAEATYALFVELGTRNMQAHAFLGPALEKFLPLLEEYILSAIDQAKVEAGL